MADIFVIDDQAPEDMAMLQALYSRSPASVVSHLEKLKAVGSGKFMEQYYVGYGHASIGDCGMTTVFIEQVSMLVAKAVQDNPLYSGQEASTRYLDFSRQALHDPYNHPASAAILADWMKLYNATLPKLVEGLKKQYPFDPAQYKTEKVWSNALNARAFDIARSLLPVGTTTLLSWTTNLRQARDHLRRLKHHPLAEVRAVAQDIFAGLYLKYPNSFKADDMTRADSRDAYAGQFTTTSYVAKADDVIARNTLSAAELAQLAKGEVIARRTALDLEGLRRNEQEVLASRPSGSALPWRLEAYGRYNLFFLLDFGSFRDIQRHRNGVCQIPVLDARFGLHPWYRQQYAQLLGPADLAALDEQFEALLERVKALPQQGIVTSDLNDQYLLPMGLSALVGVSYSVPQMVYVGELRSGKTVHGSLRPIAQKMLKLVQADLPGIAIHGDFDVDDWSAKRGEQTIAEKQSA